MKYFLGILVIALGTLMVIKTEWFLQNFGRNDWAEQHLGIEGGSRLMYKLLGILFVVGSFLAMTGMLGEIFISIFGRAFGL
jgi:CDP-diglyceride synthetase